MKPETAAFLGRQIGHIRVVDVLGEGGMGAVYVGFDDTLQRKVALKAIRAEFRLSAEARARFLREARILSRLDHPAVCTVFDFIEHEECDFLVMELVDGRNLREVMAGGIDTAHAMEMGRQLLEVLAAVHGEGVIHRDLKPENIMVLPSGAIKVLDFGPSRSVDDEAAVSSTVMTMGMSSCGVDLESAGTVAGPSGSSSSVYVKTRLGTVLGTVGYMSPEQARGEPATAASDMYSFGLLFQELLTGEPPFARDLEPREILTRAAEGDTVAPRGLPGDLSQLILRLKSLAPGARPSSPDALGMLEEIIDRPRQHRRRNIRAAVVLAVVLITAFMYRQNWLARREATVAAARATREAARAELEAETARQVSEFLQTIFTVSDPGESRGNTVSARELLDRAADRIERDLEGQPLLQARLMATMGEVYRGLGLYGRAASLHETALEKRRSRLGPRHEDVASSLSLLGQVRWHEGRLDEAERLLAEALEIHEEVLGPDHLEVGTDLNWLANVVSDRGRLDEARRIYERALDIRETSLGPDHPDVAWTVSNIGVVYQVQGRLEEAERYLRRAMEIRARSLPANHPDVAAGEDNYGWLLLYLDRFEEAEEVLKSALASWEDTLGPDHENVGDALLGLAVACLRQGRLDEALAYGERSMAVLEKGLSPSHAQVARGLDYLGQIHEARGDAAAAARCRQRAASIRPAAD